MSKVKEIISGIYFSMPVQLLIMQTRYHKLMLIQWLFLFLAVSSAFGVSVGIPYLFLDPEYMGSVGFWSLFILGCGFGAFFASWYIATYIQDAYHFHFLVIEKHPFLVFVTNNSILPFTFVILFSVRFLSFQQYISGGMLPETGVKLLGFYLGIGLVLSLIFLYFSKTNKNVFQLVGEKFVQEELQTRRVILAKAKAGMTARTRVDIFFRNPLSLQKPDDTIPPDFRGIVRLLNQNHGNALFVQFIFLLTIVGLGLLERNAFIQFPAAASILIFFSILMMLTSAFTFWFRKLGPLLIVMLVSLYLVLDYYDVFRNRHQALGMNYLTEPAVYNADRLYELAGWDTIQADIENTRRILDNWKAQSTQHDSLGKKPKLVLLCTSGGGLRSAYFTFRCLQTLDEMTGGDFFEKTRLISGASGGMIGAAYFRELFLMRKRGQIKNPDEREYAERLAKDLLNRIAFKMVTGLFYPSGKVHIGSFAYPSDRGWSFDDQLINNLEVFRDRRLSDYRVPETQGDIPMMVLSPVVMNDGRKLYISPLPVSYYSRSLMENGSLGKGVTGIEFRRFFEKQMADSLLFVTALRMNASFPLITPYIHLPSIPVVSTIDAGIADNFGIQTAARFVYLFHDWLMENTSEVLLLQIRDSELRTTRVPKIRRKSLINEILDPVGSTYSSFSLSKDISSEDYQNFAEAWLPGKLKILTLEYSRIDSLGLKASLSWHLTEKEKEDLENSLAKEKNRDTFREIAAWLKHQ